MHIYSERNERIKAMYFMQIIKESTKRKRETNINNKTPIKSVQPSEYLSNHWWQRSMLIYISEGAHLSLPALSDIIHRYSNLYFIQLYILCTYTYTVGDSINVFFLNKKDIYTLNKTSFKSVTLPWKKDFLSSFNSTFCCLNIGVNNCI